jgi:hypothetical protein
MAKVKVGQIYRRNIDGVRGALSFHNANTGAIYLSVGTHEEVVYRVQLKENWTLVEDVCPICGRNYPASETVTLANPQTGHTLDMCNDCAWDWPPEPVTRAIPEREV